jgi:hypothetical protein
MVRNLQQGMGIDIIHVECEHNVVHNKIASAWEVALLKVKTVIQPFQT